MGTRNKKTKRGKTKYLVAVVLVLAVIVAVGAYMVSRGFSARDEPTAAEAFIARQFRRMAIPAGVRAAKNPVGVNAAVLSQAMEHFADHCSICHSNDGSGKTLIGRGLYPKPPDMRESETQQLTDGELYSIIRNGVRFTGMPAFGEGPESEPDQESWMLVDFIRHLPDMTAAELEKMAKMNPKSPMQLDKEEEIRRFLQGDDSPPAVESHQHH